MKRLLALAVLGLITAPLMAGEMRTWTDTKGRNVTAEMVGMKDGKVLMKMENGKTLAFPLNLLSAGDQKFVRDNAPIDTGTAARNIDRLVMTKLLEANIEIRDEIKKVYESPTSAAFTASDKTKKLDELKYLQQMTFPTGGVAGTKESPTFKNVMNDEQFVRRVYLDIGGRIPTYDETVAFLENRSRDKRAQLIDELLDSEAFVSHFFTFLSDLLRIRDGIGMNGLNGIKTGAYVDWTKDQIRSNRPWDEWVGEMVASQGSYWENPAVGYMLTDIGMPLCNLSNTFTVFTGTEITCAQCHDHPFEEVYQMDFYRMAAFFGGVSLRSNSEEGKVASTALKNYQAEWRKMNAGKTPMPRFDRNLQDILGSYRYGATDAATGSVRLPHDYKYDDADPMESVSPAAYFGKVVELEEFENPRMAFADWMTDKEHPRFTVNIVNRLWKFAFGLGQIEPVHNIPGHLDGQAQNYELLKYLEEIMLGLDYDIKGFLRVLYNSRAYQQEANHRSPTMAQVDKGEYHFSAPVLRRMTSEQLWDSMVALSTNKPEAARTRVLEDYQAFMQTDWSKVSFQQALELKNKFNSMGGIQSMEMSDMDMAAMGGNRGRGGMVRASEQRLPAPVGSMLFKFGQSDKLIIENSNSVGSVPQVMFMLNGDLTNKTMVRDETAVVRNARAAKSQADGVTTVFLSVLNRKPTSDEATQAKNLVQGEDYSDLIWALLNTREFMFIQ